MRNSNNKGSRSNVNKHELVNYDSIIILLKKIEKVKDFTFIRKGPYYSDIFNKIKGYPPPPFINTPEMTDVCLSFVLLFTIRRNILYVYKFKSAHIGFRNQAFKFNNI